MLDVAQLLGAHHMSGQRAAASSALISGGLDERVQENTEDSTGRTVNINFGHPNELDYLTLKDRGNKRPIDDVHAYIKEINGFNVVESSSSSLELFYEDYQFPEKRLIDILNFEKEQIKSTPRQDVVDISSTNSSGEASVGHKECNENSVGIVDRGLSGEMLDEKKYLETLVFSDWTKADFDAFIEAVKRNGRKEGETIIREVSYEISKPESEIRRYLETFWRRYKELRGFEGLLESVDVYEATRKKKKSVHSAISLLLDKYDNKIPSIAVQYGATKGRSYTDEEDVFLILMMYKHGFGSWDEIRYEIARSPLFRGDWFLKSRTSMEVKRRCETLVSVIEKDAQ